MKTWHVVHGFAEKNTMNIMTRQERGIFFPRYYYYWYFGQDCPGLDRRMHE
jgi:hypothetical protein